MVARPRRRLTLCAERLEDRTLMTSASLAAGVLTITGSASGETIGIHSTGGQITIDGVNGAFAAAQVKSISIDGRGGNDAINLSVAAGNKALAVPITIHGESGTDTVTAPGGAVVARRRGQHADDLGRHCHA